MTDELLASPPVGPDRGGNDARTLRGRQSALRADAGLARSAKPELKTARQLVQVIDGGAMPAQPDHWFLGNPVDLGGSESEGGAPQTAVDATQPVPFVAIWHVPSVGDQVVISAVGGRWVGERGAPCTTKVCLSVCGGIPVLGATVNVSAATPDHTLLRSCTTDATGCCNVRLPAGTYLVQVIVSGQVVSSANRTLNCHTVTIALGAAGLVCCGGYAIPQVLTLTDAAASLAFVYYPNSFVPTWYGGHAVTRSSCSVTTPNNICVPAPASQGPVRVCYQMICFAGTHPTFSFQRSWSWVYAPGTLTPIWYQDPSGFVAGQPCTTGPPAMCGSPHTDISTDAKDPTTTSPFAIAFNPTPPPGTNFTADPVGGTVAIS